MNNNLENRRNFGLCTALLFVISTLLATSVSRAQGNDLSIKTLAGKYSRGDGFYSNTLTIRRDGSFGFDGCGDLPDSSIHEEGRLEFVKNGDLLMHIRTQKEILWFKWTEPQEFELLPVKWGERLYLIGDCPGFCDAINTEMSESEN